eukprot:UN06973
MQTYINPDDFVVYRNGILKFTDFGAWVTDFMVQAVWLTEKRADNFENVRVGEKFVALDYEINYTNACGDVSHGVQALMVYHCEAGKVVRLDTMRDGTTNNDFLYKTYLCIFGDP